MVQGVGFRPFVKRLADRLSISGIVANTAGGVVIDVETNGASEVEDFVEALQSEAPAIARIETVAVQALPVAAGFTSFEIESSQPVSGEFTLISPDGATAMRLRIAPTADPVLDHEEHSVRSREYHDGAVPDVQRMHRGVP